MLKDEFLAIKNCILRHPILIIIILLTFTFLIGEILIMSFFPFEFPKYDYKSAIRIDGGKLDIHIDCYLNYIDSESHIAREGDKIICKFNFNNTGNKTYLINGTLDNSLMTMEQNSTEIWAAGQYNHANPNSTISSESRKIGTGIIGRHRFSILLSTYDSNQSLIDNSITFELPLKISEYRVFSEDSYEQRNQQMLALQITLLLAAIYSSISATKNLIDIFNTKKEKTKNKN